MGEGPDPAMPPVPVSEGGDVEVIAEEPAWLDAGEDWEALATCLSALIHDMLEDCCPGGVALLLADDATLQTLNRDFRGKDRPTNVLSFPAAPGAGMLGDIALSFQTCAREAQEQGKTLRDHAAHLILHGILHLHGFDHETGDEDAEEMEALERDILSQIGINDPYRERRILHA